MRIDSRGNPDVCRVEYTPVSDEAKVMIVALKLTMNQIIADLHKLQLMNTSGEIKRLLAVSITGLEEATSTAVKGLTSEGLITKEAPKDARPNQDQQAPKAP